MIHFLPDPADCVTATAEPLARIAGLGQALAATEALTGATGNGADQAAISAAWPTASDAQHALFDALSAHAVAGSVAGLEALATLRGAGLDANRAAIDTLTASIKSELDRLGQLLTL